jgi:hypothetical protein
MSYKTASLVAQNTFTDWIKPKPQKALGQDSLGYLDLVISGTWAGTLTVQKRHGHGNHTDDITWTSEFDVEDFTANTAKLIEDHSVTAQYRVGFKTGNYTSGTAEVRLEQ